MACCVYGALTTSGTSMDYDLAEDQELQDRLRSLMALIRPMQAVGVNKQRYGRDWDGGYVILNTAEKAQIVYSLGISDDVSFDEVMANFGAEVFQYDHTVDGPPKSHPKFHFQKIGIAASDDWLPNMKRLDSLVKINKHQECQDMFLKMDIEGHEWSTYDEIDPAVLSLFDQIVCEFHGSKHFRNNDYLSRAERAFTKLNASHQVVHVHGNNNAEMPVIAGMAIPDVFELTFARRSRYEFINSPDTFPTKLDMPCTPARPELVLGSFVY